MKQLDIIETNNAALSDKNEFIKAVTWIKEQGGEINRFIEDETHYSFVARSHNERPLVLLNGELILAGQYPTRAQMQEWLQIAEKAHLPCCGHCGG